MLLNCGVGEDSWDLDFKEIQPVHPKGNQSWIFTGRTDAKAETPTLWPPDAKNWHIWKDWCWERLKAGGDGWMASPTQWTWVWKSSGSWWWTGKPGVLQSTGSQSRTQLSDWTELNQATIEIVEILHLLPEKFTKKDVLMPNKKIDQQTYISVLMWKLSQHFS